MPGRRAAATLLFAALLLGLSACGTNGEAEQERTGPCAGSPLRGRADLPPGFPKPDAVTYTRAFMQGPTSVVEGYWTGELGDAYRAYLGGFEGAGFDILFDELEEKDSEVSWRSGERSGQVALREDCDPDHVFVHITNRPA